MTDFSQQEAFARYLAARFTQADAITPGQKLAVIQTLRQETFEQGRVPLSGGPVRVDVTNEAVQAALNGRAVALDGQMVQRQAPGKTSAEGLATLSPGKKLVILAGVLIVPLLVFALFLLSRNRGNEDAESADVTAEATEENSSMLGMIQPEEPTGTATETPFPSTPTPEVTPTLVPPEIIIVTPTPFPALQINERGNVAGEGNDPASLEVAGFAYILTTGNVNNGLWEPRGAEWLQGTTLRRVITVPYDEALLQALFAMPAQQTIKLRLRSGEIVSYTLQEVARVGQTEIDVLSAPYPSLAIVLYGEEASDTRWVVIGEAVQADSDFVEYGRLSAPIPSSLPTEFITVTESELRLEDLKLSLNDCQEVADVEGQAPPGSNQRFISCSVTLNVLTTGLETEENLAVTEQAWAASASGWLPFQTVHTHTLNADDSVELIVTGVVNQLSERGNESQPVLLWQRADATYLFPLTLSE